MCNHLDYINKLAINGGPKIRTEMFPSQNTIGEREIAAATRVLKSGFLTGYQGNAGVGFYGGPEVRGLEEEWREFFGNKSKFLHCIPINSCTSGLIVACGAAGIKPGDEVIVTPYSMTCSATAPMAWGGIPVFADIDPNTFNLDPYDVEQKITSKTKAIIVVDLFGLPYDCRIDEIAKKHNLIVIEDAAQAVMAKRGGEYAGTLGHIGVFSFNLGKHLTCGEGGMICTYDDDLAEKCRLLMNHAESVVNDQCMEQKLDSAKIWENKIDYYSNHADLFGFNLRMTEVNAAIVRVQLSRMCDLILSRMINVSKLSNLLNEIPGLHLPQFPDKYRHTYYVLPVVFEEEAWGIHRNKVVDAVKAELMPCAGRFHNNEGVTIGSGYIVPLWRMPVFSKLYPTNVYLSHPAVLPSPTPVCDRMWSRDLIIMHRFFGPNAEEGDMEQIAAAFQKVWDNWEEL